MYAHETFTVMCEPCKLENRMQFPAWAFGEIMSIDDIELNITESFEIDIEAYLMEVTLTAEEYVMLIMRARELEVEATVPGLRFEHVSKCKEETLKVGALAERKLSELKNAIARFRSGDRINKAIVT